MPVGSGFGFVVFSALPAGKEKAAWGSKPMGSGLFICVGGFVALIFRSDLIQRPSVRVIRTAAKPASSGRATQAATPAALPTNRK